MSEFPIRLNKYLAEQGIASRREADVLIADKKVHINGQKAVIGQKVNEGDEVEVVGQTKETHYLAYYKGRGVITHSPASHEVDIETKIKKDYGLSGVHPVGRLDKDSEGLIILSDDGRITGPLLNPETKHDKVYEVIVDKRINNYFVKNMSSGVNIEGYVTKPAVVELKSEKRFFITLTEGKKHQIRRMCAALGYQIQSLKRVRIMNIELGELKPNQYRKIAGEELQTFLTSLGVK